MQHFSTVGKDEVGGSIVLPRLALETLRRIKHNNVSHNDKSFHYELLNNDQKNMTTNTITNITMLPSFQNGGGHSEVTLPCTSPTSS